MVQEILFKRFLIWSSGGLPAQWFGTIYAILKEVIMGNISFEANLNLDKWFRRRCHLKKKLRDDGRPTKTDHIISPLSFRLIRAKK